MQNISSIRELIDLWPSRRELAAGIGVPVDRVHKWAAANRIPPEYHRPVLDLAERAGHCVSADLLIDLHAGYKRRGAA